MISGNKKLCLAVVAVLSAASALCSNVNPEMDGQVIKAEISRRANAEKRDL